MAFRGEQGHSAACEPLLFMSCEPQLFLAWAALHVGRGHVLVSLVSAMRRHFATLKS